MTPTGAAPRLSHPGALARTQRQIPAPPKSQCRVSASELGSADNFQQKRLWLEVAFFVGHLGVSQGSRLPVVRTNGAMSSWSS